VPVCGDDWPWGLLASYRPPPSHLRLPTSLLGAAGLTGAAARIGSLIIHSSLHSFNTSLLRTGCVPGSFSPWGHVHEKDR